LCGFIVTLATDWLRACQLDRSSDCSSTDHRLPWTRTPRIERTQAIKSQADEGDDRCDESATHIEQKGMLMTSVHKKIWLTYATIVIFLQGFVVFLILKQAGAWVLEA